MAIFYDIISTEALVQPAGPMFKSASGGKGKGKRVPFPLPALMYERGSSWLDYRGTYLQEASQSLFSIVSMDIAQYVCDVDSWYMYNDMPQPVAWYVSLFKVVSRLDSLLW